MTDSMNLVSEAKPSLIHRFFIKVAGGRSRLSMEDFPGGWTDMVYVETLVKLTLSERVKILFLGRLIIYQYVLCEREPGKTKATTQCFVGHPLDDLHYKLPTEEKTE